MTSVIVPTIAKEMNGINMMGYEGEELARILIEYSAARRDFIQENSLIMDKLMDKTTETDHRQVVKEAAHFYQDHYL